MVRTAVFLLFDLVPLALLRHRMGMASRFTIPNLNKFFRPCRITHMRMVILDLTTLINQVLLHLPSVVVLPVFQIVILHLLSLEAEMRVVLHLYNLVLHRRTAGPLVLAFPSLLHPRLTSTILRRRTMPRTLRTAKTLRARGRQVSEMPPEAVILVLAITGVVVRPPCLIANEVIGIVVENVKYRHTAPRHVVHRLLVSTMTRGIVNVDPLTSTIVERL